ncbi:protein wech-like [Mytilus edulis]|uniref:protein wech-like n=1 Tax=Mytilus edulis TaxID=6550 RepID=UPI0039EFA3B6
MAQAASMTCEICVSASGSSYCLDCEQYYCENCKILHTRQKLSTTHEFKEATDFIPEVKSKCIDHNEAFTFVCVDCDVPLCCCCVTEQHNGHKMSKLKDTISQLKTKLEQELLIKFNKTSGNASKLEKNLLLFNGQVEFVIKSITKEGNKIQLMVDQYTANTIASLQDQARKENEQLLALLSDHKSALDKAYTLDNRQKQIAEHSRHDGTLVELLKSLNEDIDQLEVYPLPEFQSVIYTQTIVTEDDKITWDV